MAHLDENLNSPVLQVSLSLLCPDLRYGNTTLIIYAPKDTW